MLLATQTPATPLHIQYLVNASIPPEQFPRSIVVANDTTMSLTCHEEIGRVGRIGQGCYEDASNLAVTSRACRAREICRTT